MSREQLLAGGVGSEAVKHRLRRKRLHPVHRGVYSPMHPELLSRLGQWMAAVLAGGPGAVLSYLRPQRSGASPPPEPVRCT